LAILTPEKRFAQFVLVGEWLVLLVALVYFGSRTLPRSWQKLNTDFPNYYLTARLLHEGYDTNRIYEWIWFQRQKDHRQIDESIVGFVSLTPFSALVMRPLAKWPALTAKHVWLGLNALFLFGTALLLHSLTGLCWRRVAILLLLCFPMYRNLLYGQYYILLLFLVTAALWLYVRDKRLSAGALLGIGFGLKIFPVLFLLYFARKRDWRAICGLVIAGFATIAASIAAFGVPLNRVYATQVLPWALRGDAMDPYSLVSSSLSSLLHRLLIFEPEWNPHPITHAPSLFAVLHPLLQLLILSPAILYSVPEDMRPRQLRLEWAAFLVGLLAISTLPASYHFTLLILPVAVMGTVLIEDKNWRSLAILLMLYLGVCFPGWNNNIGDGWSALLSVPRLYLLLALCVFIYVTLAAQRSKNATAEMDRRLWVVALACALFFAVATTLHHQKGLFDNYRWRLPTSSNVLIATSPTAPNGSVLFTALSDGGYRSGRLFDGRVQFRNDPVDQLAQTSSATDQWIEEAAQESQVVKADANQTVPTLHQAESPVASLDGKWLAFLRPERGRGRIWLKELDGLKSEIGPITPTDLNVLEMSFGPEEKLVFSALTSDGIARLFTAERSGNIRKLAIDQARYPAISPDGHWLAYSQLAHGVWNLWVADIHAGDSRRLTRAECNDVTPSWERDSKTLIYASDCGRALWFTALCRRRVIP
jgi:Glycosyltransferase family 87/WD40-like Beta Propeller Repeat